MNVMQKLTQRRCYEFSHRFASSIVEYAFETNWKRVLKLTMHKSDSMFDNLYALVGSLAGEEIGGDVG